MLYTSELTIQNETEFRGACEHSECVGSFLHTPNTSMPFNYTDAHHGMVCMFETTTENFMASSLFQMCVLFMYSAVFVVALVGNGLVCFVVQTSPRMKTVTNYFIVNLAVGDILMTLFCVPFSFVSMLVLRYWPFGAVMCKVVNYSQAVSVLVSAYTLLAISIDRYMAIMRPLKPRLGKATAKLVVAGVWCGALATAAPIPIVSNLQRPSLWHEACEIDICGELWASAEQSSQYTCALLALQFALPLAALVCTYARIAHAVWGGRPPGEAQSARDTRMQRSKRKMIKMMVTVVAVFTISWLPLNVFIVLWTTHESDAEWGAWPGMPYVWFASHWLAMSHSCYNPIIYCYMNARYRRGFKQKLILFNSMTVYDWTDYGYDAPMGYVVADFSNTSWRRIESYHEKKKYYASGQRLVERPAEQCSIGTTVKRNTKVLGGLLCLKHTEARSCHRSSVCEGVPMSEMVGLNCSSARRGVAGCRCRPRNGVLGISSKCKCNSLELKVCPTAPRPPAPPARALSVRSNYFT